MKKKALITCAAVSIALILVVLSGLSLWKRLPPPYPPDYSPRVVVIGIDGATWHIINPMLEEGKLPNIRKLISRGACGKLKSVEPMLSPLLWTTIATGLAPEQHGIVSFISKRDGNVVSSYERKAKALWNIASERGKSCGVINWWATWPPEEINGFMVSDRLTAGEVSDGVLYSYPAELNLELTAVARKIWKMDTADCKEYFRKYHRELPDLKYEPGWTSNPFSDKYYYNQCIWHFMEGLRKDLCTLRVAKKVLNEKGIPDLLLIYFRGVDFLSHYLFGYTQLGGESFYPRDGSLKRIEEFESLVPLYYEYVDKLLGEFLKQLPEDAIKIVVSDHGFWTIISKRYLLGLDRMLGKIQLADGNGNQKDTMLSIVSDISSDFFSYDRTLRIGLDGDRSTRQKRIDMVVKTLISVVNERDEKLLEVVPSVVESEDQQEAEIKVTIRSDVLNNTKYIRLPSVETDKFAITRIFPELRWSGNHNIDGIIILQGPDIIRGKKIRRASINDVAKTVLYLMRLPIGEDMVGKVLTQAVRKRFLRNRPIKYIPTYGPRVEQAAVIKAPREQEEQLKKELRSLGYIE